MDSRNPFYRHAALLTLSPSMLLRFRVKGKGPRYLQIGGAVRYARVDLLERVLTMRRGGTSEEQAGAPKEKSLNFDPVLMHHASERQLYWSASLV